VPAASTWERPTHRKVEVAFFVWIESIMGSLQSADLFLDLLPKCRVASDQASTARCQLVRISLSKSFAVVVAR
jgi:hypothetical protein